MNVDKIEESSVRLLGRSSSSGGSSESRWVDGNEVDWDEAPMWSKHDGREGYGSIRRRLVKKPKRVDSFDVEAVEIAGTHGPHSKDLSLWPTLVLAFKTLGVVYGDMGTSPLYVFADVFSKVPIGSDADVLGALSLVMYTIALIPLAKYVFIVLKANDNGEGGTFALYSLICRYANVNLLPNRQQADEHISSFKLKLPTPELERALKIKETLEKTSTLKNVLLVLVLLGTSMIIGDGILTPAISVMSAISGLQDQINGFGTGEVVCVSIVVLLALFSIQRFGTSKVGFMFAPVIALWFFSLGSIGIYNILTYDITVLRAFNPAYIYYFFKNNGKGAWSALGGCVLCITGAEAMFADLGHFSVPAIQIAFTCVVFPCLLLAYMGQAAFLMKNPASYSSIFYKSVPGIAEVGVMMVSTTLVTIVMLLIWQTNLFLALCFPLLFGSVELIYMSSVLSKITEGGWLPLAFATFFLSVMYIWNYGSVLKYRSEVREKFSVDLMLDLGFNLGTVRVPGIGLLYNELVQGIPSIFLQFLLNLPALHSTIVFVCIKYVPIPVVPQEERFLFRRVCPKDYHIFRCVARYGYKDVRKEDHHAFEQLLIESLEKFLRREAQETALELQGNLSDDMDNVSVHTRDSDLPTADDELRIPLMHGKKLEATGTSSTPQEAASTLPSSYMSSDEDPSLEYELAALREAMESGCTYLLGHGDVRAKKNSFFIKKLVINYFYAFLRKNCRGGTANMRVPHTNIIQVGMTYMV
ncbi:putative potassium transporter 12 isoform X2 [Abrus precatorius]|uniref:Potassium transporter 12 isoform X2 n=1 Tax=Abrus precatorius TaxID=3816 RepID=A0A8B8KMM3_ABRPR|nr:putative potassium transporter 12 isoform X2 [Abrus precatorius]